MAASLYCSKGGSPLPSSLLSVENRPDHSKNKYPSMLTFFGSFLFLLFHNSSNVKLYFKILNEANNAISITQSPLSIPHYLITKNMGLEQ